MGFELQWKSFMHNDAHHRRIARYKLADARVSVMIMDTPNLTDERYGVTHFSGVDMSSRNFGSLIEVVAYLMECGLWPSD